MRQNQNDNQRQQAEQPPRQPTQQPPTQQQPTQHQPTQHQPTQHQQSPQQPPQNPQGQPPQSMQSPQRQPTQGQQPQGQGQPQQGQTPMPQASRGGQQGGQQLQQPPQMTPGMQGGQQMPPEGMGMQSGMAAQQGQMQQMGPQGGVGAQPPQQMGRGRSHLQPVTIDDILQEDVVTAQPDTPLPTITAQMETEDVGAVVIVEDDKPVSLLTDRKIALSLEEMPDLNERTAEDIMSGDIVTGSDSMSVYEAIQQMSEENIRRLPVTDDEGKLVGIVTLDDVIVLISSELQDTAEIIKAQSPRL